MTAPRLVISRPNGRTDTIELGPQTVTLGRYSDRTVAIGDTDVSREHAEVVRVARGFLLRDTSKYGTFVNGRKITEHVLCHRDQIRLGPSSDSLIVFKSGDTDSELRLMTGSGEFLQLAALLAGLRALGAGRVLDDVLAVVIDSAIEASGAERGFIMLAGPDGGLQFTMGRERGQFTLPMQPSATSRQVPNEVFATGTSQIVDLGDEAVAGVHPATVAHGIRYALCVALSLVRLGEAVEADRADARIGVLYLDSRVGGVLTSPKTREALEALAGGAAVAIENARLYRESCEKARLDQELRIAADVQHALMPPGAHGGAGFDVAGASIPCRAIGGDFFDYLSLEDGAIGVAVGDVSGKGVPAALLTAAVQGMFGIEAARGVGPAATLGQISRGLKRRDIRAKFVTMFFGILSADGTFVYSNGGHNAPMLLRRGGCSRLETGGTILGAFDATVYEQESLTLEPGDTIVVFSDGVSEAQNAAGDYFGEERLLACLEAHRGAAPTDMRDAIVTSVKEFVAGAPPTDDITVLVLTYRGA